MNSEHKGVCRIPRFAPFCEINSATIRQKWKQGLLVVAHNFVAFSVPVILLLSGCTPSVKAPPEVKGGPVISALKRARFVPADAPITVIIQGSGFTEDSVVRIASSIESAYVKDFKPVQVESDRLEVRVDRESLDDCARGGRDASRLASLVFAQAFSAQVVNPDGQVSKSKQLYLQPFGVHLREVDVRGPLKITPGSRRELNLFVDRGTWRGDIPLRAIGFDADERHARLRLSTPQSTNQVAGITGRAIVSSEASSAKLAVDVDADVPPGKYVVMLGLDFDIQPATGLGPLNEVSLYDRETPMTKWPVIELEVVGQPEVCVTCLPLPPEIVKVRRMLGGYICIYFEDNSTSESGFRIMRSPIWSDPSLPQYESEEVGTIGPSEGTGEHLDLTDTTVDTQKWYNYHVVAWNNAGESWSHGIFADPPYPLPSDLRVFFRRNDFLLEWMDNSPEDSGMKVFRKTGRDPYAPFEEVADLSFLMSQGTGRVSWADRHVKPNVKYSYQVFAHSHGLAGSNIVSARFYEGLSPEVPSDLWILDSGRRLRWQDNATNELGYKIERNIGEEPYERAGQHGAYRGTGWAEYRTGWQAEPEMAYGYRVIAWNNHGESATSTGTSEPPLSKPEAPGDVQLVDVKANSVRVTWKDRSRNESGFKVQRERSGQDWREVYSRGASSGTGRLEWNDSGLSPSTQYCYRVIAYNDAGTSRSGEVCETTLAQPRPELVFDSFYVVPTTTQAGPDTPFMMRYIACNASEVETGSFTDRLYFPDRNGQIKTADIKQGSIPAYGCYESWKYFPDGLPEGCYRFTVSLDVKNDVSEKSEQPGYIWDPSQTPYDPFNEAYVDNCWWD